MLRNHPGVPDFVQKPSVVSHCESTAHTTCLLNPPSCCAVNTQLAATARAWLERHCRAIFGRDESDDEGTAVGASKRTRSARRTGASARAEGITADAGGVAGSSEALCKVCANHRGEENLADDSHSSRVRRGRGAANGARLPQGQDSRRSPVSILGRAAAGLERWSPPSLLLQHWTRTSTGTNLERSPFITTISHQLIHWRKSSY